MVKRPAKTTPLRAALTQTEIRKGIARLENLKIIFEKFNPNSIQTDDDVGFVELTTAARSALEKTFASDTAQHQQFSYLGSLEYQIPMYVGRRTQGQELHEALIRLRSKSLVLINQGIADLREELKEEDNFPATGPDSLTERIAFVVHGHDDGFREAVARFLERLTISPVILHEQPNKGRTLIEKFEQHGKVPLAIVLLSPDDVGGKSQNELRPRARQNVILELGYFIGSLGRSKVCALKKNDVEEPTDIFGIVYINFDAGGAWKIALAKEIQAAGIEVDWNVVMQ